MTIESIVLLLFTTQDTMGSHREIQDEGVVVEELVRELGDESPAVRDDAHRTLFRVGRAAEVRLEQIFSRTRDPEIRERLHQVLRFFRLSRIQGDIWAWKIISSSDYREVIKHISESGLGKNIVSPSTASLLEQDVLSRLSSVADKTEVIKLIIEHRCDRLKGVLVTLAHDADMTVRVEAALALTVFQESGYLLELLPRMTAESDAGLCLRILDALGRLSLSTSTSRMESWLRHEDWRVREATVQLVAVSRMHCASENIAGLLFDPSCRVRGAAASALAELGANSFAPHVVILLQDENSETRACAIKALGRMSAHVFGADLARCLRDGERKCRWAAIRALESLQLREYVDDIASLLRDRDENTRIAAVTALAQLDAPNLLSNLAIAFADTSPHVRHAAVSAVGKVGVRGVDHTLMIVAATDPDDEVKLGALELLCSRGNSEFVFEMAKVGSTVDRWVASKAIGRCRTPTATHQLTALLEVEANEDVRCVLRWSLKRCMAGEHGSMLQEPGVIEADSNY